MSRKHPWRRSLFGGVVVLCLLAWACLAQAQTGGEQIAEPTPGQWGKDVIWLPSEQSLVDNMLALAKVTPADYVIDLGSGDGRIVITAAKQGSRALGIEYDANLVEVSKRNAVRAGVPDRAQFIQGDIFQKDFSQATVLTMFLLPRLNMQLRPQILDMKPGTRIVSNSFDMEDWEPDQRKALTQADGCASGFCDILLWVVPARVSGLWRLPQGELQLQQKFQFLTGTFNNSNGATPISDGRVRGSQISFRIGEARYTGELVGSAIQGTVAGSQDGRWIAQRVDR
jgi:hypothetical protein